MIDVKDIKVLNKLECTCNNHTYTLNDLKKLEKLTDTNGFYANLVKHYSLSTCPKCGKEVILLLKQKGQTWEVMNTAEFTDTQTNKDVLEPMKEIEKEVIEEITGEKELTIDSDNEDDKNQEFICEVCKRSFKTKSGLTLHMKKHQK